MGLLVHGFFCDNLLGITGNIMRKVKSPMGSVCDTAFVFGKRLGGVSTSRLRVKEQHDPKRMELGKILEDGGREATRLWNIRVGLSA